MANSIEIPVRLRIDPNDLAMVERLKEAGVFNIQLCGHVEHAGDVKGFTLDKRKYRLRIEDETEDSMRVIIEPK